MGALTVYLQREFARLCPAEWTCRREVRLLTPDLEDLLGYGPRADVLLEHGSTGHRLWIEFEVSRADPVANHAKFATVHLFDPQPPNHAFVAMVSPHVARGRRNLAANMVSLMRHLGINAFQTVLFPRLSPSEVKRLNHLDLRSLTAEHPPVEPEIERAFCVSQTVLTVCDRRLHFAGDLVEVLLNLRQWNQDIREAGEVWGRRVVTYFVFDPRSRQFAPSKFCAYVPLRAPGDQAHGHGSSRFPMTLEVYAKIDPTQPLFDGTGAHTHLAGRLGMVTLTPQEAPAIAQAFQHWLSRHSETVQVHPSGPRFLVPPQWFG